MASSESLSRKYISAGSFCEADELSCVTLTLHPALSSSAMFNFSCSNCSASRLQLDDAPELAIENLVFFQASISSIQRLLNEEQPTGLAVAGQARHHLPVRVENRNLMLRPEAGGQVRCRPEPGRDEIERFSIGADAGLLGIEVERAIRRPARPVVDPEPPGDAVQSLVACGDGMDESEPASATCPARGGSSRPRHRFVKSFTATSRVASRRGSSIPENRATPMPLTSMGSFTPSS